MMGKRFDEMMTGQTAEQRAEAERRQRSEQQAIEARQATNQAAAPSQEKPAKAPLTNEEYVGFVTAVIMPIIGVLVGCALIIKGSSRAAEIVGWATAFWIIWSAVFGYGFSAGWFT